MIAGAIRIMSMHSARYGFYSFKNRSCQELTNEKVLVMLMERLDSFEIEEMKKDVRPFLRNPNDIDCWDRNFFCDVFGRLIAK